MPLEVGIGSSVNTQPDIAMKETLAQVEITLGNKTPHFAILFGSVGTYDYATILKEFHKRHSQTPLIGCTTSGQITSSGVFEQGITILAFHSDQHKFIPFMQPDHGANSFSAGQLCGRQIASTHSDPSLILLFSGGLRGNQQQLLDGFTNAILSPPPIFGGVASDNYILQTYQFFNTSIFPAAVVGVAIVGRLSITAGNTHGWIPIGTAKSITSTDQQKIITLNDQPAISIYRQIFEELRLKTALQGNFAQFSSNYPLGMYIPSLQDYIMRTPLKVDEQGTILCDAHFPFSDQPLSIMISSPQEALNAYNHMLTQIAEQTMTSKRSALCLMFNSSARKKLLSNKKEEEVTGFLNLFTAAAPLVGMYTFGEFFTPLDKSASPFYQNQSVSILMIS